MKRIRIILFLLTVVVFNILFINAYINRYKVELVGDNYIEIEVNEEYKDEGFSIKFNGKQIDKSRYSYSINNEVVTTKLGNYDYSYVIKLNNKTYELHRNVYVRDSISPIINVNYEEVNKSFCTNKIVEVLEYTATDNFDGDLSNNIKKTEENDLIILTVSDSSNNLGVKKIKINKEKEPSNYIKLNGSESISLAINSTYNEQGAFLYTGCGSKLNNEITIEGEVDTSKLGTYTIKYSTNDSGKIITKNRTVTVKDNVKTSSNKIVYLTFDDGPGSYTQKLLDTLDKYNVKATFFVTNQYPNYQNMIGEEARRGHAVAVHSLTHKWTIYSSVNDYMSDFNQMNDIIENQTGSKTKLFRFPGGSSNAVSTKYSKGIVTTLANKLQSEGYVYFDWNVDSNDAGGANSDAIYNNVIKGISSKSDAVVLMHDVKKSTVDVIDRILEYGVNNGYTFKVLDVSSPTAHHSIRN